MSATSKPKLSHLVEYLDPIKSRWKRFGTYLEIDDNDLEAIGKDKYDCDEKLTEVCRKWLQINPDGMWEDVIEALEKMGRQDVIKHIKEDIFHERSVLPKRKKKKTNKKKNKKLTDDSPSRHSYEDSDTTTSISDYTAKKEHYFNPQSIITPLVLLIGTFDYILSHMQTDLNDLMKTKNLVFEQFTRFVCIFFSIKMHTIQISPKSDKDKIDALFRSLNLSCFDTLLLLNIDHKYLDTKYEQKIKDYDDDLEKFEKEKSISDLIDMVEECHDKNSDNTIIVVLKLGRFWNNRNVKNLDHLMKHLFGHNHSLLNLIKIHHSILTVVYKTPKWALLSLIVSVAKVKDDVMVAGIHSIQIGTVLWNIHTKLTVNPNRRLVTLPLPDPQTIKFLFNIGANLNLATDVGRGYRVTPVEFATLFGTDHILRMLLSLGANPNGLGLDSAPLLQASIHDKSHNVFLLLYYGANPNIQNSKEQTAILLSSWRGNDRIVSLLLRFKADPNIRAIDGVTALYAASQDGYINCVKLLLESKANPNIKDIMPGRGKFPLYMACQENKYDCAKLLLEYKANPNAQKLNGATPLYVAGQEGRIEIVLLLLKFGADPNIARKDCYTLVHIATLSNHYKCLSILISSLADVNAKTNQGQTAASMATQLNHIKCLELLLKSNADPNIKDTVDELAPVHLASQNDHWKCLKLLLNANADPNAQWTTGSTPLHMAAENGNVQCVKLLLQAGAYVDTKNKTGITPLHKACYNRRYECVLLLLKTGANPNIFVNRSSALDTAIQNDNREIVKLLVSHGAYVDYDDTTMSSPLLDAVYYKKYNIVKDLIEFGVNVNTQNSFGATPLILASMAETNIKIVQLLLDNGADPFMTDNYGVTAFSRSVQFGNKQITQLLAQACQRDERKPITEDPSKLKTFNHEQMIMNFKSQAESAEVLFKDQFKPPIYMYNTAA